MQLKDFLTKQSLTVSRVAKDLDVPEVTVNSWKYGNKIPSKKNMKLIMNYTNSEVQPNYFYDTE